MTVSTPLTLTGQQRVVRSSGIEKATWSVPRHRTKVQAMNDRQRFIATMHYQPRDRAPLYDFNFWDETLPQWHDRGLPHSVNRANAHRFFGLDQSLGGGNVHGALDVNVNVMLCPAFEHKVLEDRGDHELVQQNDGVRVLRKKWMGSIPHPQSHLLTDRASWQAHYKPRLDPDNAHRFPRDWDRRVAYWAAPHRQHMLQLPGGSLYGRLRNWMGVEHISYLVYDDPALFEEMVVTVTDCIVGTLERVLAAGGSFEACGMWEDMCYSGGPLLSPAMFRKYLVPNYRRITELLHRHGVDVAWVDCDGCIDDLIPLWLEAGVNCMFPIEVGTWGADPVAYRREFGRELLLMGGFDKHILQRTPREIEREVHRLAPLVEEGGFIPMPDHRVPPDVPLDNYLCYAHKAREVWGRNVNLDAMGTPQANAEIV